MLLVRISPPLLVTTLFVVVGSGMLFFGAAAAAASDTMNTTALHQQQTRNTRSSSRQAKDSPKNHEEHNQAKFLSMMEAIHQDFKQFLASSLNNNDNSKDKNSVEGRGYKNHRRKNLALHRGLGWKDDWLVVEIVSKAGVFDDLEATLNAMEGVETTGCSNALGDASRCSAWVDMKLFDDIANTLMTSQENLVQIYPSVTLTNQRGSVVTEGLQGLRVDRVRSSIDPSLTGSGLKVGVIKDSFNNLGGYVSDIISGDLPATVVVLKDFSGEGSDEGRAMMQLLHDLVPDATLYFRTGSGGSLETVAAIQELADAGCDVIIDSISYLGQPFFQDGLIAQAANDVAQFRGIPYFSAAGNYRTHSWEGIFQPDPSYLTILAYTWPVLPVGNWNCLLHDFGGGNVFQRITFKYPDTIFEFQWSDPFGSATRDMDIHVFDSAKQYLGGYVQNSIGLDPLIITRLSGTLNLVFCLNGSFSGSDLRMKWIVYESDDDALASVEHATNSGTITAQKNALYTAAVGAVDYINTPAFGVPIPILQSYSSYGNVAILFDRQGRRLSAPETRRQPRMSSIDGVGTTFYWYSTTRNPNGQGFYFFGTSAAAPQAAAVALLLIQAARASGIKLSPVDIYNIMQNSAVDMGTPGFDYASGYGLVDAEAALLMLGNLTNSSSTSPSPVPQSTALPSPGPASRPTAIPSPGPMHQPTVFPSPSPTHQPTTSPSPSPVSSPTTTPVPAPTSRPTLRPSVSLEIPTALPTEAETCSPPFDCGGQCGDCQQMRPGQVGCSCPKCECRVCEADPWCCDKNNDAGWDIYCVSAASELCTCGNVSSTRFPTTSPTSLPTMKQVTDSPTKATVCGLGFCGNCKIERPGEAGCECEACENLVCNADPVCCEPDNGWDNFCVGAALSMCDCEGPASDKCFLEPVSGCSGPSANGYSFSTGCQGCENILCQMSTLVCECTDSAAPFASSDPSESPSRTPSVSPSSKPSLEPSSAPSVSPSSMPSPGPSGIPSFNPSGAPTLAISAAPSIVPTTAAPFVEQGGFTCTEPCTCSNCFFARRVKACAGTGGCVACGQQVCLEMPECCETAWTNACGVKAQQVCTCCL